MLPVALNSDLFAVCIYPFNNIFYGLQVFLQTAHKNIIVVGPGNFQKLFIRRRTGSIQRLAV